MVSVDTSHYGMNIIRKYFITGKNEAFLEFEATPAFLSHGILPKNHHVLVMRGQYSYKKKQVRLIVTKVFSCFQCLIFCYINLTSWQLAQ